MNKQTILEHYDFFRNGSEAFRSRLLETVGYVRLPKGAFYFHEGDVCAQVALVGAGRIRVYKTGETGREITLYHVVAGESCLINISCMLSTTRCPASARVESAVEALVIPGDRFRRWVAENENVRNYVFDLIAKRMASVMSLVEEVTFQRMDERVARFLEENFEKSSGTQTVLLLTHEKIASQLGTAREVVSRLLKEFERVGAIRLSRGQIVLQDRDLLKSFSNRR